MSLEPGGTIERETNGNIKYHCTCGRILSTASIHNHLHSEAHLTPIYTVEETEEIEENEEVEECNCSFKNKFELNLTEDDARPYKLVISNNSLKVYFN